MGFLILNVNPPTNVEITSLPHAVMTSNIDWDPTTYNIDVSNIISSYDASIDPVHPSNVR
jgi:hypothetical protein